MGVARGGDLDDARQTLVPQVPHTSESRYKCECQDSLLRHPSRAEALPAEWTYEGLYRLSGSTRLIRMSFHNSSEWSAATLRGLMVSVRLWPYRSAFLASSSGGIEHGLRVAIRAISLLTHRSAVVVRYFRTDATARSLEP